MIHPITVASERDKPQRPEGGVSIYVGRPSPLGNPYRLDRGASEEERAEVIARYATWLDEQLSAPHMTDAAYLFGQMQEIARTRPLQLVCWCSPKACHADIIAERLRAALSGGDDGQTH